MACTVSIAATAASAAAALFAATDGTTETQYIRIVGHFTTS